MVAIGPCMPREGWNDRSVAREVCATQRVRPLRCSARPGSPLIVNDRSLFRLKAPPLVGPLLDEVGGQTTQAERGEQSDPVDHGEPRRDRKKGNEGRESYPMDRPEQEQSRGIHKK